MTPRPDPAIRLYRHVLADRLALEVLDNDSGRSIVPFTVHGLRAQARITAADLSFCWIQAGFDRPDLPQEMILRICSEISQQIRLAKAVLTEDAIVVSVEAFTGPAQTLPTAETLTAVLPPLLSCLGSASQLLREQVTLATIEQELADTGDLAELADQLNPDPAPDTP